MALRFLFGASEGKQDLLAGGGIQGKSNPARNVASRKVREIFHRLLGEEETYKLEAFKCCEVAKLSP